MRATSGNFSVGSYVGFVLGHLPVHSGFSVGEFFLVVRKFNRQRQCKKRRRPASKKEATPTETPTMSAAGARLSQKYRPITSY